MYSDRNQPLNNGLNQAQYSDRNYVQNPYQPQQNNYSNNNNYYLSNNQQPEYNQYNYAISDTVAQGQPYVNNQQQFQQRQSFEIQNNFNYNQNNNFNPPQKTYIIKQSKKDPLAHLNDGLQGRARKGFIKKVYLILAFQLLITIGMCFASYYSRSFLQFQVHQYWLMIVTCVFAIIVQIVIFCCPAGRQHPTNLVLLIIFTLCEAYMVSYITSIVAYNKGGAQIVIIAAIMTFGIVAALTLYAIFTRTDFTIKWGIVIVIFMAMLFLGIFSWIAWTPFLNILYCSLGIILFGIYIVIDTQLIIGGKSFQLSMDDYVVGALLLYIDIIQIFLYILMILGGGRR